MRYDAQMSTTRKTAVGRQFRARWDAELARVGSILGQEIAWSPGEVELLETVERDLERRAVLDRTLAQCPDPGAPRALRISQESRLLEAQTARLVAKLQKELSKLLAQQPVEEKPQAPLSPVSRKAQHAANTRWHREKLRQQTIQQEYRAPDATG
jgi:hypothetical protein